MFSFILSDSIFQYLSFTNLTTAFSSSLHSPLVFGQVYLWIGYCSELAGVLKLKIKNRRNSLFKIITFLLILNILSITKKSVGRNVGRIPFDFLKPSIWWCLAVSCRSKSTYTLSVINFLKEGIIFLFSTWFSFQILRMMYAFDLYFFGLSLI